MPDITNKPKSKLPLRRDISLFYIISLVIVILMIAASIAGLFLPDRFYPTDDLVLAFYPNDVINLFIGLPILLISMWLTRRGNLSGLLLWPGALFFVVYNYLIYILAMPLNWLYLADLLLVVLSIYTTIALTASIDSSEVQMKLSGKVFEAVGGGILAGLGMLFALRVIGVLIPLITSQTPIPNTELALNTADFIMTPAWIIGGVMLWRRQPLGYVAGLGLLFQASMLFIGLILVLILQPFLVGSPFLLTDTLIVAVMSLIGVVPFGLFLRGIIKDQP